MMDHRHVISIDSEEAAFEELQRAVERIGDTQHVVTPVQFIGWPNLVIRLPYTQKSASISPSMMQAFIEYQEAIYRIERLVGAETIDLRSLTDERRKLFEYHVVVTDGSSNLSVDLTEIFYRLGAELGAKKPPGHVVMSILGLAAIFVSGSVLRAFLHAKVEKRKEELSSGERLELLRTQRFLSQEETKRLFIISGAKGRVPLLARAPDTARP
jgi:hypothetical protein